MSLHPGEETASLSKIVIPMVFLGVCFSSQHHLASAAVLHVAVTRSVSYCILIGRLIVIDVCLGYKVRMKKGV